MKTPGNKLLLSGNGQCNITHIGSVSDFFTHYGTKGQFVKPSLLEYPNSYLLEFLQQGGILLEETEGGKIFPQSRKSAEILAFLTKEFQHRGGELRCCCSVRSLKKKEDIFEVTLESGEVIGSQTVLIATGGLTRPQTGTTGDGYRWANELGHDIVTPRSALASIEIDRKDLTACKGISFFSPRILISGREKQHPPLHGDILLTHRGLSGPGILDSSRYMGVGDSLMIGLVPFLVPDEFEQVLLKATEATGSKEVRTILREMGLADRLVSVIFQSLQINEDVRCSQLDRNDRKKIVASFIAFPCRVTAIAGFDQAMVTAGGVALEEVDRKTMMSRKTRGLFFAGEVLDVDGDTGGYNLQFAFSSGALAGRHAARLSKGQFSKTIF